MQTVHQIKKYITAVTFADTFRDSIFTRKKQNIFFSTILELIVNRLGFAGLTEKCNRIDLNISSVSCLDDFWYRKKFHNIPLNVRV